MIRPACKLCKESAEKDAAYVMAAPRVVESNHIFLDLEKLQPELSEWIKKASVKGEWSDNAIQITMGQLNNGLQSRPITKDLKWGTPVPKAGFEQKVFYVWSARGGKGGARADQIGVSGPCTRRAPSRRPCTRC